jgi:hypothetical protein
MARLFRGLTVLAVLVLSSPAAQATPLAPGKTVLGSTPGNVVSTISGTVIAVTPFQDSTFFVMGASGPIVGFVSSAVVKTAASGLDFVYQVNVSAGAVTGLSITSFHNTTTDVTQTADRSALSNTNQFFPGDVQVASYMRSATVGDTINLTFAGAGVTAEEASYIVIVQTNSPTYAMSTASVSVNGSGSLLIVDTLAPVPEPSTLALWAGTFGGFGCFITWRRRGVVPAPA